ncbi:guanylate kinase [Lachnospiraceae bacterium]|nr:guanylate kinase [Eubacterium sp.]GFI25724.1 guanylate kinase [Lachnospiraceae bacterium]
MGKIFCMMGKSSSGKDTLYQQILDYEGLLLKSIVLYTTRPIRSGEKDGKEYIFADEDMLARLTEAGKVIECRSYHTVHGVWKYFTVNDGQIDLTRQNYLTIATLESYLKIRDYFGEDFVMPIYIEVEDGVRLRRALEREEAQSNPRYAEMCRRFLADMVDFSEEKLAAAGITRRFFNEDLDEVRREITAYIRKFI